ncbi:hamartin [Caerostris extrusa]|uniref:Hamartin n=1 Tax=Caerostris extrusa TaxID=172846 RepID=A0AAV4YDB5_CAEEX|nr:hamartin [Caerostris extrusa]
MSTPCHMHPILPIRSNRRVPLFRSFSLRNINLLSLIVSLTFLNDTFEIFSKLASWGVKKPSFIVDVFLIHLQVGIYSLFHRLYGLFPCNFLAYLRSYYGSSQNYDENYKPILSRVKLHPLLVTASKETELHPKRWKKMAYHDIVLECAAISVDAIEGTTESGRNKYLTSSANEQNINSYDSSQFNYYSNQSSCSINYESEIAGSDMIWSPNGSLTVPYSSSNATSPIPQKHKLSMEEVPLDIAVEAKPELLKLETNDSKYPLQTLRDTSSGQGTKDSDKIKLNSASRSLLEDANITPAVEAKEDDIDKEVSELTSGQNSSTKMVPTNTRHDTPFCSTTQNLTDKPVELSKAISNLERSDSITKSQEEESEEMFNSLQESDVGSFLPSFNRYRFFSQCGQPPDIPALENAKKPKVLRSQSWPASIDPSETKALPITTGSGRNASGQESLTACNKSIASTSAFVPVTSDIDIIVPHKLSSYEEFIPLAVNPLEHLKQIDVVGFEARFSSQNTILNSLSPPELLDRYIEFNHSISSQNLLSNIPIPSTSNTDWTHFGGKPPVDEVTILRTQILLLHNQLLFERHRKDIHSERNRGLLRKCKKSKIQEEHIGALKEQIALLEKDNSYLKNQADTKVKLRQHLQTEMQQQENNLHSRILKAEHENKQFQFSIRNLQKVLVSQKEENDALREINNNCQQEITLLKHQVDHATRKASQCEKIEKDAIFLSKQLILLQELIRNYNEKMEMLKGKQEPDINIRLLKEALVIELNDLKEKLDAKCQLLDATKGRVASLEQIITELETKLKNQMEAIKVMKSIHENEMEVRNERLESLKNILNGKDTHILDLYANIEALSKEKVVKQITNDVNYVDPSCQSSETGALSQFPSNSTAALDRNDCNKNKS